MTKKIVALLLALVMVLSMTACAKTETPAADAPVADAPVDDAPAADTPADAPAASGEVAQLMYYMYSNSDTAVREAVQNAINAYIEPLIGANVTFNMISSGDWSNKAVTGLQAGEEIDIFFTADWLSYMTCVTMNLFTPLNDDNGPNGNLLNTYGQGVIETLNPAFITGTQVEGVNYAVPTNKELCVPMGFIYNVDAAAEVGMDPAAITGIQDFEPFLAKYKELYPDRYGYLADGSWGNEPWVAGNVSNLNGNLIAMKYDPDPATGEFDTTWYSVWETEENKAHVELMYKWAQAGYIHPDSSLTDFNVTTAAEFAAGEWLFVSQPLKGANIKGAELVQASGNPNLNVDEIYGQGKVCITTHAGGSMLAIPVTANHPVEAMKYINLLHTDSTLLDMQLFGVPEEHWKLAEDGRVEVVDSQWYGSHGGAWTMGNTALQNVTTVEDPEKNKKLQEYSEGSLMHPSLGFRYVQQPELEAQWAAVNNVQTEYNRALLTGAVDPATALPAYIQALKDAGLDAIKENVQSQYDAWLAASGK